MTYFNGIPDTDRSSETASALSVKNRQALNTGYGTVSFSDDGVSTLRYFLDGGFKGSAQLLGEPMRLQMTEEVAEWGNHI